MHFKNYKTSKLWLSKKLMKEVCKNIKMKLLKKG